MTDSLLILTSSSTGNNIFCTPAIRLIRKYLPKVQMDVLALNDLSAQVFAHNPDIHRVWVTQRLRRLHRIARGYTHILALNKNALKKLPFEDPRLEVVPALNEDEHHAEQLLKFCQGWLQRHYSCSVMLNDTDRRYALYTAPDQRDMLAGHGLQASDTLINLHLGCGTTVLHGWKFFYARRADDKKLWSIDAYIQLGLMLVQAVSNVRIVITGTSNEAFLAKKFAKAVPGCINLVGKTTVADLRQLMDRSNLFISHDCGVFHVAAAANVPMLGLFGPTNHQLTGPYPMLDDRVLIKKANMAEISPDNVLEHALSLLGRKVS